MHNSLINLLLVRKGLGHSLLLQAPLCPCNYLGALCIYVTVWFAMKPTSTFLLHVVLFFFFFFFFQPAIVDFVNCEQRICLLFTVPQIILFSNFFIKNGSHNTIYTFKNYFATVFLVSVFSFSKNKLNPNTPYVDIAKYLKDMEPAIESDKRKVHKPKCFTPKVRLVTKLPFQYLEGFKKFLLAYLQLFSFCCPYLH